MCQEKVQTAVRSQHRQESDSTERVAGDSDGQRRVHQIARPALAQWAAEDDDLTAVKLRLTSAFVFGLLWIPLWLVFKTTVFDEAAIGLLFVLSIFAFVVSGCLYELLNDLERAKTVWWDDSIPATVGLYTLAAMVWVGGTNAVGRLLWRCVFEVEYPDGSDHPTEADRSSRSVLDRLRPYGTQLSLVSLVLTIPGVAFWERLWAGVLSVNSSVADGGATAVLLVGGAAVVVGVAVGGAFAVVDR